MLNVLYYKWPVGNALINNLIRIDIISKHIFRIQKKNCFVNLYTF